MRICVKNQNHQNRYELRDCIYTLVSIFLISLLVLNVIVNYVFQYKMQN